MADSRIIDIPEKLEYVPAYVEIDTGINSYRQSIATLVSSVVSAYILADQAQNNSLGLNADNSMPTVAGTNYMDGDVSHLAALKSLDTQLGVVSAYVGGTTYSNNYVIVDSNSHQTALGALDAAVQNLNSSINAVSLASASVGATRTTLKVTPAMLAAIFAGTARNFIDLALGATGRYAMIHDVFVDVDTKTSAHVATGSLFLSYSSTYSAANKIVEITSSVLNASVDTRMIPTINGSAGVAGVIKDQDIYLITNTGTITEGDTDIYITVLYSTISRDASIAPPA